MKFTLGLSLLLVGCHVEALGEVTVVGDAAPSTTNPDAAPGAVVDARKAQADAATTPVDTSLAQLCVDELNKKRALIGVPALSRNASKESCVAEQCQIDSASNTPHGSFGRCEESNQSQCAGGGWAPGELVPYCINGFYEEGPGNDLAHAHYAMLANPIYTSVACGIYKNGGSLWFIADYYR